eukprot:GFUD01018856.1.p1 GENE.GFUD01018856.1~~GFUD01018856.1.p1  ORF type:complete len:533 (-),score=134.62 GFUD01018856.1:55-1605(-)
MKLQSKNIFQHVLNCCYSDNTHCDAVLRVSGHSVPCHRAILASVSPVLRYILDDVHMECLEDVLSITLAGYTYQEVKSYMKCWYGQGGGGEESVNIKVESVFNVKEDKRVAKSEPDEEAVNDDYDYYGNIDNYDYQLEENKKIKVKNRNDDNDESYCPKLKIAKKKDIKPMKFLSGTCEFCSKEYKHLKDHMHDKHFEKVKEKYNRTSLYPQDCPFCGLSILNRKVKSRHPCFKKSRINVDFRKIRHSDSRVIELTEQEKMDVRKEMLSTKMSDVELDFICHLCGINCPSKSSLTNHVQMKCGNVCEICKEIFANKTEVKLHMFNAHQKIKKMRDLVDTDLTHECNQCEKKYSTIHNLNTHIKYAHSEEVVKVQCPDCGRLFSTTGALKKHSSLHKPPELPCPICGKLFHNNQYLLRHAMSVHGDSSEKKFKCDLCEKGFDTKPAMDGHKNWHLNLKPYQCRWCERTYQNQSNCNAHERKTHTEEYKSIIKNGNRRIQVDSIEKSAAKVEEIFRLF